MIQFDSSGALVKKISDLQKTTEAKIISRLHCKMSITPSQKHTDRAWENRNYTCKK